MDCLNFINFQVVSIGRLDGHYINVARTAFCQNTCSSELVKTIVLPQVAVPNQNRRLPFFCLETNVNNCFQSDTFNFNCTLLVRR